MTPDQMVGGIPIFYVEFTYNSIVYRIAQNAMDTANDNGRVYYTDGLLNFDYSETVNIGDIEANSVGCQLAIPGVDVITLAHRGLGMDGIQCEFGFYIWRNGEILQTYENRGVLFRGQIQNPQFGDPDEPNNFVSFSIEAQPYTPNQLLLDVGIIDQRFPDRDIDTADGKPYPIVLGQPGHVLANGELRQIYATPAYCTQKYNNNDAHFMICGHDLTYNVGGTVTIIDSNGQSAVKTPVRDVDTYGNVYHYVRIFPSDNVAMPGYGGSGDSSEWWIYWNTPALPNRYGTTLGATNEALTRGGDVLRWAMERTGQRIDMGAFANVAALLNRYKFSGYMNEATIYAWEWLQGNILPLLPIGLRIGPNGLRPVLDQLSMLTSVQPQHRWFIGDDYEIVQTTAVTQTTDLGDIQNDITIKYAYNGYGDDYAGVSRCRHIRQTQNELVTDVAKISVNRYGVKQAALDTKYVYDGATADLIVQTMVRTNGLPRYEFTVVANIQYGYVQIGDIISVTAPRLGLDAHNVMAVGKRWANTVWEFTLQYDINPNITQ